VALAVSRPSVACRWRRHSFRSSKEIAISFLDIDRLQYSATDNWRKEWPPISIFWVYIPFEHPELDFRSIVSLAQVVRSERSSRWLRCFLTTGLFTTFDCVKFFNANDSLVIEQLADLCLRIIQKNQARAPYHLCGYSLGGVVAYEAAARLANAGEDTGLLALIDAPNPSFKSNLSGDEATHFRRRHFTDRIAIYGRNLRSGNFATLLEDALVFLDSRLGGYPWLLARAAFRTVNRPMPPILANKTPKWSAALEAYTPKPYPKRLLLFCSQSHKPEYGLDPTLGWRKCATGDVDVYFVPEAHVKIMTRPQFLAEKLIANWDQSTETG
jgi:thioesterase domain-containing protein